MLPFILNTEPPPGVELFPVKLKAEGTLTFCAFVEGGLLNKPALALVDEVADVKGLRPPAPLFPKLNED